MTRQQFLRGALAGALAAPLLMRSAISAATKSAPPPHTPPANAPLEACAVDVRDFGARGDGMAKDHRAIQAAIDSCAARGGGTILIPPGTYVCGTIELKSNTCLHLGAGAVIAASPDRADYRRLLAGNQFFTGVQTQPANHDEYLIVGFKATNVSITAADSDVLMPSSSEP